MQQEHYTEEQILQGALLDYDAVIRSATKLFKKEIEASSSANGGIGFIGRFWCWCR